jgi:hypothetical protein
MNWHFAAQLRVKQQSMSRILKLADHRCSHLKQTNWPGLTVQTSEWPSERGC